MTTIHRSLFMFGDRRSAAAFWFGSLVVAIGVGLHLPMFLMARDMGYMLAGMPMDTGMLAGMALIVLGTGVAGYGLLPKDAGVAASARAARHHRAAGRRAADAAPIGG